MRRTFSSESKVFSVSANLGSIAAVLAVVCLAVVTEGAVYGAEPRPPYDPGQKIMQPALFAEGIISTDLDEGGSSFSPDGTDFYFSVFAPYTTAPRFAMICVSHFRDGRWQKPETASFSGKYMDTAPRLSQDGRRLFFASVRPTPEAKAPRFRVWVAEKSGAGWGEPKPLPSPVNVEGSHALDPSVTADGTLYFASDRSNEGGHFHIWRSRFLDGRYQQPEKLGPEINSDFSESSPAISADETVLVFASSSSPEDEARRRPEDLIAAGKPYPRQDLYISMKRNGQWSPARHLEHGVNSSAEEVYPGFTPDGKFLFWGSERSGFEIPTSALTRNQVEQLWHSPMNGRGNIYFISTEALEMNK